MTKLILPFVFFVIALCGNAAFSQERIVDVPHSRIGFTVSHLVISELGGSFPEFELDFAANHADFSDATLKLTIRVAAINTDNPMRDEHLRSADFFDAERYPAIVFAGKGLQKVRDHDYKLTGNLTIRDVTKETTLDVVFKGATKNPLTQQTVEVFQITGTIDRLAYGVGSGVPESVVGKDVALNAHVELVKK